MDRERFIRLAKQWNLEGITKEEFQEWNQLRISLNIPNCPNCVKRQQFNDWDDDFQHYEAFSEQCYECNNLGFIVSDEERVFIEGHQQAI